MVQEMLEIYFIPHSMGCRRPRLTCGKREDLRVLRQHTDWHLHPALPHVLKMCHTPFHLNLQVLDKSHEKDAKRTILETNQLGLKMTRDMIGKNRVVALFSRRSRDQFAARRFLAR